MRGMIDATGLFLYVEFNMWETVDAGYYFGVVTQQEDVLVPLTSQLTPALFRRPISIEAPVSMPE